LVLFLTNIILPSQISSFSQSCYTHIRELRYIRPCTLIVKVSSIAASIVHCKLDYCNSLYYNLPKSQINHLQRFRSVLHVM